MDDTRAWRILRSLDEYRARITNFNAHEALETIKILCQSHSDEFIISYMRAAIEQVQPDVPEDVWPAIRDDSPPTRTVEAAAEAQPTEEPSSSSDISDEGPDSSPSPVQEIFIPPSFPPTPEPPSPTSDQTWTQWSTPVLPTFSPFAAYGAHLPPPRLVVRVHPHVSYNMQNPIIPYFHWDILHPPEHGCFYDFYLPRKLNFDEPSVSPPCSRIEIVTDHPVLMFWMSTNWGPIVVEKDGNASLSLGELLNAIYHYFRRPLTDKDMDILCATPGNRERLDIAHKLRAQNSFELDVFVLKNTLRRVDVLGSHRQFQGLRSVIFPDSSWKLFLGLLPSDRY